MEVVAARARNRVLACVKSRTERVWKRHRRVCAPTCSRPPPNDGEAQKGERDNDDDDETTQDRVFEMVTLHGGDME